ncbi:MAG: hypothetical protein JNM70_10205, partial [Anaerolineae bacterium]|nr:hypothetical protein [Anaerolineae bacterium]
EMHWEDEDKTILICRANGSWKWEEYHLAVEAIAELIASVPHRVDLITLRGAGIVMPRGSSVPHFMRPTRIMPPNLGKNILVIEGAEFGYAAQAMRLFFKAVGSQFVLMNSFEDAHALIAADRRIPA